MAWWRNGRGTCNTFSVLGKIVVGISTHLGWAEADLPNAGLIAWSALASGGQLASGKMVLVQDW